jgi:predicted NBD/HSP70 family sugar kinase
MELTGMNSKSMFNTNRLSVLKVLATNKIFTRVQISKLIGLKQATITKIINEMGALGMIYETGSIEGKKGRRSIGIRLKSEKLKTLAVRISRDYYQLGIFDVSGKLYSVEDRIYVKNESVEQIITMLKDDINKTICADNSILAIGIAVPGPYLRNEGKIAILADYEGWERIDFHKEFMNEFSIPVCIDHDANAGVLAEWQYSHSSRKGVLLHIICGSGLGSGLIENGKLITGYRGIAGEIGHMSIEHDGPLCSCGNRGCFRLYATMPAFVRMTREKLHKHPHSCLNDLHNISSDDIFDGARNGDAYCISAVKKLGYFVGVGIANTVYAYDANHIVISGKIVNGGELLMRFIKSTVKTRLLPKLYEDLIIEYSEFGKDTILYGAAAMAANLIFSPKQNSKFKMFS